MTSHPDDLGNDMLEVPQPALLFDLDGTLVDSVYQHVIAWQEALTECGIELSVWRIHRRIGMSGGLFTRAAARELGHEIPEEDAKALQSRHGELFRELLPERRALPGAGLPGTLVDLVISPEHHHRRP